MTGSRATGTPVSADVPCASGVDFAKLKADFPFSTAPCTAIGSSTSTRPRRPSARRAVLDAMDDYYETTHANVHRGVYAIAEEADRRYEAARMAVGRFIGAPDPEHEVIFTKNATEAINLVAATWGRANLRPGDAIVLTEMEHHANLVPWLMLAEERGVELRWLDMDDDYRLDLSDLDRLARRREARGLHHHVERARDDPTLRPASPTPPTRAGALVLADGAQSVPHLPTDVGRLGCDFLAFSAHKMLGPTGIGVLWARRDLLEAMPPFLGGGGMIRDVRHDGFTANELPWKFEAGTPPIAEAVGLGAAVALPGGRRAWTPSTGPRGGAHRLRPVRPWRSASATTSRIFGPAGTAETAAGCCRWPTATSTPTTWPRSSTRPGVCVRAGHHCAKPLMRRLGVTATARASFYLYNDESDVDVLVEALAEAGTLFG